VPASQPVWFHPKKLTATHFFAANRGIKDADEGRTVLMDEVRKMIPKWISKFESQNPR